MPGGKLSGEGGLGVGGYWVGQQRCAASAASERGLRVLVCALPGGLNAFPVARGGGGTGHHSSLGAFPSRHPHFRKISGSVRTPFGERSGAGGGARARPSKFLVGLELGVCYLGCAGAGRSAGSGILEQRVCQAAAGGDRLPGGLCSRAAAGALPALLLKERGSGACVCNGLVSKLQ